MTPADVIAGRARWCVVDGDAAGEGGGMTTIPCRCPSCGRLWLALTAPLDGPMPPHRWPGDSTWCGALYTVRDAAREYAADAEARAEDYRYRAEVRRLAMASPLRGELPGDVADLCRWDDRAAVWAQRALWVRAVIGGGL